MNPLVPNRKQPMVPAVSAAFRNPFPVRQPLITLLVTALYLPVSAQTVTELITDYNGYWKSANSPRSSVKPDNSHNLLAFSYNGTRYSTGVNDALLTDRGDPFVPGDYRALQVYQISNPPGSNTKIGLGALYDGVYNGPSNPRPANTIAQYLTDGINGLNLGTGVANLPAGEVMFAITGLQASFIGDGIPDLLVTQVADPSGSLDSYEFTDMNGNRVGNKVDITLSTLPILGNWVADFYDAHVTPMNLSAGFTQTERAIRIWAADFSAFGINSTNINQVTYFRIRLSGNSDVAFVAYNNQTVNLGGTLPTRLSWFKGRAAQQQVILTWQTEMEQQLDRFVIESSYDGRHFFTLDSVKAAGNSFSVKNYTYTQRHPINGKAWYRLKQTDENGAYTYSEMIIVNSIHEKHTAIRVYPNPVHNKLILQHGPATGEEQYMIRNMQGITLLQQRPATGSVQSVFQVQQLPAGTYLLVVSNGQEQHTEILLKK